MAARTLVQKFKVYTEENEMDRDKMYDFLFCRKGILTQGTNFSIEADLMDNLSITIDQDDSRTIITCHHQDMSVWVGRHYRKSANSDGSHCFSFEFPLLFSIRYV